MAVRTTGQLQLLFTAERENTIEIQLPESNNKKPKNLKYRPLVRLEFHRCFTFLTKLFSSFFKKITLFTE